MIHALLLSVLSLLIFLNYQVLGIVGGDSGDLVTAAYGFGVPHPPGFPLYTFISWLLSQIPLFTVSWRITLLSSIPHALTIGLMYLIVRELTSHRISGIIASLLLLGNYIFFYYSVTPEVFALNDMFLSLLVLFSLKLISTKSIRYLYVLISVFSLSLSHHHIILFGFPAILYLFLKLKGKLEYTPTRLIFMMCIFIAGLLPYIYIPIAASANPVINWENASTLPGFIELVTRSRYGTFLSASVIGLSLTERILQIKTYISFLIMDFRIYTVVVAFIGVLWLFLRKRTETVFLAILFLISGPAYFFYASYPLLGNFSLGVFERFLLQSYLVVTIFAGLGFYAVNYLMSKYLITNKVIHNLALTVINLSAFGFCLNLLFVNSVNFSGFRQDRTVEYLAMDYLDTVPQNSLLLLVGDMTLFPVQYMHFVNDYRPDVKLIFMSNLRKPEYYQTIRKYFPDLIVPDPGKDNLLREFLILNMNQANIYTNYPIEKPENTSWIPVGLLHKLYQKNSYPTYAEIISQDSKVWENYRISNIQKGILSKYSHLMITEVLSLYAESRLRFGRMLYDNGYFLDAKPYFVDGILVGSESDMSDLYQYLGNIQMKTDDCVQAETSFINSKKLTFSPKPELDYNLSVLYRECLHDADRADLHMNLYKAALEKSETLLKDI